MQNIIIYLLRELTFLLNDFGILLVFKTLELTLWLTLERTWFKWWCLVGQFLSVIFCCGHHELGLGLMVLLCCSILVNNVGFKWALMVTNRLLLNHLQIDLINTLLIFPAAFSLIVNINLYSYLLLLLSLPNYFSDVKAWALPF